jgi:hypothetical protein
MVQENYLLKRLLYLGKLIILIFKIVEEFDHHSYDSEYLFAEFSTNLDNSLDVWTSSRTCTCESHSYTSPNMEESWGLYDFKLEYLPCASSCWKCNG